MGRGGGAAVSSAVRRPLPASCGARMNTLWQVHFIQLHTFCHPARPTHSYPLATPPSHIQLGAERLKEALQALGMKCGGTLRQRAERLMQTKGKRPEELDKSLFAKGSMPLVGPGSCMTAP